MGEGGCEKQEKGRKIKPFCICMLGDLKSFSVLMHAAAWHLTPPVSLLKGQVYLHGCLSETRLIPLVLELNT